MHQEDSLPRLNHLAHLSTLRLKHHVLTFANEVDCQFNWLVGGVYGSVRVGVDVLGTGVDHIVHIFG